MSIELFLLLMAIGLATGTLIGAVGVGGVLLVPALVLLGGLDVHEATPVATLSFLFTGIAGTVAYSRQRRIDWPTTRWLLLFAIPGAVGGASTNVALSSTSVTVVIAVTLTAAAVRSLQGTSDSGPKGSKLGPATLAVIGAVVGFGSTLSGTGGPVLLIPVMLLGGAGVKLAVSSSQPLQVPIAIFGAASFLAYGSLDWQLALSLGAAQGVGTVVGARISDRLPGEMLLRLVTWSLVASAAVFAVKAFTG
jgi:uncharacterized membrane protein YfcA